MSNYTELPRTQAFFKGLLSERISDPAKNKEYQNPFGLNLIDFDLFDDDIQKVTNLIIQTDQFNSLNIRLSDTLTDSNTLVKLLRKISLKRQFTNLGFYIKYLKDDSLEVFLDFIGKIQSSVSDLKIMVKYQNKSKEDEIFKKIFENLLKNDEFGVQNLNLNECCLCTDESQELLEKLIIKNSKILKNLTIGNRNLFSNNFNVNISKLENVKITNCQLSDIDYLPLETLDISFNNLSLDGIKYLSKLLSEQKCTLKKLDISNNLIGDDGCIFLSRGISKNKSLTKLNLSNNNILNRGIIAIAKSVKTGHGNTTISKIDFSKNQIENSGLVEFCNILQNEPKNRFKKLDFSYNNLSDRSIIEYGNFLKKHPSINLVSLTNKITDENKNNFFNSCTSLDHIKTIIFNSLDISENNFNLLNDILLKNKNIEYFNIINNRPFGSNGLLSISSGLEKNNKIIQISLIKCEISDDGAIALANALFRNMDIKEINLEDNQISEKGTKLISEKVLGKTSLNILNLSHNKINSKAALYISQGLEDAQGIQFLLLGNNKIEDEGCEFLSKGLLKNNSLISLNLEENNITNKGINSISKSLKTKENFMELIVNSNQITELEQDFYELFDWVKIINISDNPLNQSGIARLFQGSEHNRLFKNIHFKTNEKDDFKFKCLNESIKKVDLSFNRNVNISLMKHIFSLKYLSHLNLQTDNITDEDLNKIVQFCLENKSNLKVLKLKNNKITKEGAKYISELIQKSENLKILDLSANNLKSEGVKIICNAITENNNHLEQLIINANKCNDYCSEDIFNMLIKNKKLTSLSIVSNFFTNKGIDKILSALRKNNTLKHLSIGENKIDNNAFNNLPNYLKFNKTLTNLEIKSSRVNDDSLIELSKAIMQNNNLVNLNLIDNSLSYEGMIKFGQYVSKNNRLNEINVLFNKPQKEEQSLLKSCNPHIIFNK